MEGFISSVGFREFEFEGRRSLDLGNSRDRGSRLSINDERLVKVCSEKEFVTGSHFKYEDGNALSILIHRFVRSQMINHS